jgi:phosphatidylglycerol:prolipoprotein diacylglycerol transferase
MKKIAAVSLGIIIVLGTIFFILVPAFAGQLQINPVLQIGPIALRWYGLILAASILVGFFIARNNSWKFGISKSDLDDYAFWLVLLGVIGARIYYVIFNYNYFAQYPDEIYQIWQGGLSVYGSILAGLIFTFFYTRKKAYTFWQLFDLIALSLPLAQALGRFGNFVNQEAFGTPTNLPWKMFVSVRSRPPQFINFDYFHPAFLYEAILNVTIFFILYKILGKVKTGVLGLCYLLFYSLGRFFIEAIRLDSFFIYGFRVDQVVAFLVVLISGALILRKQFATSVN